MTAPVSSKSEVLWFCPQCGVKRRYDAYLKHALDAHGIYAPIFTRLDPKTDIAELDDAVTRLVCKLEPEER
jgi:uncharacterized C2H2 Zn-finger protein